jgi:hypothetical protein
MRQRISDTATPVIEKKRQKELIHIFRKELIDVEQLPDENRKRIKLPSL